MKKIRNLIAFPVKGVMYVLAYGILTPVTFVIHLLGLIHNKIATA